MLFRSRWRVIDQPQFVAVVSVFYYYFSLNRQSRVAFTKNKQQKNKTLLSRHPAMLVWASLFTSNIANTYIKDVCAHFRNTCDRTLPHPPLLVLFCNGRSLNGNSGSMKPCAPCSFSRSNCKL